MKVINSATTISLREPNSRTGTQLGEHGLETAASLPKHVHPDQAADMMRSWRDLLHTPIGSEIERQEIEAKIEALKTPATPKWITGRVATLLAQYFVGNLSEQMMTAIAADWEHELRPYPAWAIANAVRWWMGADNPERRKKPMVGDIAERCVKEMELVRVAEICLNRDTIYSPQLEYRNERVSAEAASEIMAKAGFTAKKI